MRVGIYARVSTQDQQTLPLQLEVMRKYAKTRKWPIILEIKDIGSGVKERERRELLMQAARRREIDAVTEFEREMLKERVKAGIAQARKKGKNHGRPQTVTRHKAKIKELFSQGLPKAEIARRLKIGRTSVIRLLAS